MRSLLEDFIDCLYFINLILLSILIFKNYCKKNGAGDGNRTRVTSLEGWSSTIELHPQKNGRDDRIRTCDILLPKQARYQTAPHPDATLKHYNKNSDVFFSILLAEYTLLTGRYRYF